MNETTTYRHTREMGEISGMGYHYELCCQDMLEAGVKWLVENDHDELHLRTYKNVTGLAFAEGPQTKALERVVLEAAKGESTGAQHQAVMARLIVIAKNGWDEYARLCRETEEELRADLKWDPVADEREVRPELIAFAHLMELRLQDIDRLGDRIKGTGAEWGYKDATSVDLLGLIRIGANQIDWAIRNNFPATARRESVDLAVLAMLLGDMMYPKEEQAHE